MDHYDPRLAVLGSVEPLPDYIPQIGHAPGPSGAGQLQYDPHLQRVFEKRTPIEKKFGVRFEFPARTLKSDMQEKPLELNAFEYVVVSYRWAWTGWDANKETPISVSYGTSTDSVLKRPQLIGAIWGNPRHWTYPARAKIYRKNRQLVFQAQLDYTLSGLTEKDRDTIKGTTLDILLDGLELREK